MFETEPLDYESTEGGLILFDVKVADNDSHFDVVPVMITVEDVNDQTPQIITTQGFIVEEVSFYERGTTI